MTVRHGSRSVTVTELELREVEDSGFLPPISRAELAQRAYRLGVRAALQAIEAGRGARLEAALSGAGMGDARRDSTPEERANCTEAIAGEMEAEAAAIHRCAASARHGTHSRQEVLSNREQPHVRPPRP